MSPGRIDLRHDVQWPGRHESLHASGKVFKTTVHLEPDMASPCLSMHLYRRHSLYERGNVLRRLDAGSVFHHTADLDGIGHNRWPSCMAIVFQLGLNSGGTG